MPSFVAHAAVLLQRIQRGLSTVELVHVPHNRWPLPAHHFIRRPSPILNISVLDSSFNPPTLAHLALANTPPHLAGGGDCYDAKLLLLSVRNADKVLKQGDATYVQRLEMMMLLAQNVQPPPSTTESNVAVAIIDEPTFVGKSSVLLAFIRDRLGTATNQPRLTFLQGFDTLERLFSPRYYSSEEAMMTSLRAFFSPEGDASRVVCARRAPYSSVQDKDEREAKTITAVQVFIGGGQVVLIDIGQDERTYSSSEVREKVARKDITWRNFLSENIATYIENEKLYIA